MVKYLVLLGAFISFLGIMRYVTATIRGFSKPNRVTWIMWSVAPMIATFAALSKGVTWAVLPVFMSGFGPALVVAASYFNKNAYWKISKFDLGCGFFSLLGIILCVITKDANYAIIFAILSDFFAAIPTIIKLWKYPETENISAFVGGIFSAITAFFAASSLSFSSVGFSTYLIVVNVLMIFAYYKKKLLG